MKPVNFLHICRGKGWNVEPLCTVPLQEDQRALRFSSMQISRNTRWRRRTMSELRRICRVPERRVRNRARGNRRNTWIWTTTCCAWNRRLLAAVSRIKQSECGDKVIYPYTWIVLRSTEMYWIDKGEHGYRLYSRFDGVVAYHGEYKTVNDANTRIQILRATMAQSR